MRLVCKLVLCKFTSSLHQLRRKSSSAYCTILRSAVKEFVWLRIDDFWQSRDRRGLLNNSFRRYRCRRRLFLLLPPLLRFVRENLSSAPQSPLTMPPTPCFVWWFLVIAMYRTSRLQIFAEPQQSSRLSPEEERQSMYCLISRLLQVPLTALANNNNNYNHSVSFLYLPPPTIRSFICSANIAGLLGYGRRRRIREWLIHLRCNCCLFVRGRGMNSVLIIQNIFGNRK